jgi:predicted dehydrogenase
MRPMLKGAIFGVGHVAVNGHAPAWKERRDVEIVAAADDRPDRLDLLAQTFPDARRYGSANELLSHETLDFVDVCTPPATHAALARAALERSLHVLCEKPLVLSPEELRGLPALAAEKERTLFTVHNWKHAPVLERVTDLVRSGTIGEVRHCRWETLRDRPAVAAGDAGNWRVDPAQSGGGVLVDHGWHALYVVQAWMPTTPRTVAARLSTRKHRDYSIEDTAELMLFHPSASAEIFLTWAAEERANRMELSGTRGKLHLDGGRLSLLDVDGARTIEEWSFPSLTEGSHHPDWFGGVITEFLAEAGSPRARGHNLAEAALCANVLALAKESHRRGGEPLSAERATGPRTRR